MMTREGLQLFYFLTLSFFLSLSLSLCLSVVLSLHTRTLMHAVQTQPHRACGRGKRAGGVGPPTSPHTFYRHKLYKMYTNCIQNTHDEQKPFHLLQLHGANFACKRSNAFSPLTTFFRPLFKRLSSLSTASLIFIIERQEREREFGVVERASTETVGRTEILSNPSSALSSSFEPLSLAEQLCIIRTQLHASTHTRTQPPLYNGVGSAATDTHTDTHTHPHTLYHLSLQK